MKPGLKEIWIEKGREPEVGPHGSLFIVTSLFATRYAEYATIEGPMIDPEALRFYQMKITLPESELLSRYEYFDTPDMAVKGAERWNIRSK